MENIETTHQEHIEEETDYGDVYDEAENTLHNKLDDLTFDLINLAKRLKDGLLANLSDMLYSNGEPLDEGEIKGAIEPFEDRFKELFNMEEIEKLLKNC